MVARFPTISPIAWLTIERVTQQTLWLILFVILAPILGPHPYGLFALVMVFVGFCESILLEGTVEALVTVDALEDDHMHTANLVNIAISIVCGLLMAVLAPWLSHVFHDEEMKLVMWLLAIMPLLSALSVSPIATLWRAQRYKQLAIRSIIGLTIGGLLGIVVGVMGGGVLALVVQVLAQRVAELIIVWLAVPIKFGSRWSPTHFGELRPVASNVLVARVASLLTGQFPRVVLGYALGPTEVGYFSLASRLLDIIANVAVVPLTRIARIELRAVPAGTADFALKITTVIEKVSMLSFPCFLGLAAVVPELFRAGLDDRWAASIIPTQLMLLSGPPLTLFYSIDAALLATNLSSVFRKISNWQGFSLIVTVLCAAPFGLDITCLALVVRSWIALPILLIVFGRSCGVPIYRLLLSPLRSLVGALSVAALVSLPFFHLALLNRVAELSLLVLLGVLFYVGYLYIVARAQLMDLLADVFAHKAGRTG